MCIRMMVQECLPSKNNRPYSVHQRMFKFLKLNSKTMLYIFKGTKSNNTEYSHSQSQPIYILCGLIPADDNKSANCADGIPAQARKLAYLSRALSLFALSTVPPRTFSHIACNRYPTFNYIMLRS